jgi:hypothetical protein
VRLGYPPGELTEGTGVGGHHRDGRPDRYPGEVYRAALARKFSRTARKKGLAFVLFLGGSLDEVLRELYERSVAKDSDIRFRGLPAARRRHRASGPRCASGASYGGDGYCVESDLMAAARLRSAAGGGSAPKNRTNRFVDNSNTSGFGVKEGLSKWLIEYALNALLPLGEGLGMRAWRFSGCIQRPDLG